MASEWIQKVSPDQGGYEEDSVFGDAGLEIAVDLFKALTYSVRNISKEDSAIKADIDLELQLPNCEPIYVEVKTDRRMCFTGNVFFETKMLRNYTGKVSEGWTEYSKARYLCVICAGTGNLYLIDLPGVRKYLKSRPATEKVFNNRSDYKTVGKGIVVKIEALRRVGLIDCEVSVDVSSLWEFDWDKPPVRPVVKPGQVIMVSDKPIKIS